MDKNICFLQMLFCQHQLNLITFHFSGHFIKKNGLFCEYSYGPIVVTMDTETVHHTLFTRKLAHGPSFNLTSMDRHEIMSDQS